MEKDAIEKKVEQTASRNAAHMIRLYYNWLPRHLNEEVRRVEAAFDEFLCDREDLSQRMSHTRRAELVDQFASKMGGR